MPNITGINVQANPLVADTGSSAADTTIISTNEGGSTLVTYEIQKRDGSDTFRIASNQNISKHPQVVSISANQLKIKLRERTKYKARLHVNGVTTVWTNFKTRDKTYKTPDAITQLTDDTDDTAQSKNNRTVVVTNSAKATVVDTGRNATVTNSSDFGNGTTSITYTSRGATVVTQSF